MPQTLTTIRRAATFVGRLLGRTPDQSLYRATPPTTVFLLSFPRSGTSWIGSVLENFGAPFIYYGELLAFLSEAPGLGVLTRRYRGFRFRYLQYFIAQRRGWKPLVFERSGLSLARVMQIMAQQAGINVVKIFPGHISDDDLETLFRDFSPHVVFLRRNHMDRLTSLKAAGLTGNWQNAKYTGPEVSIDDADLHRFTVEYEAWYRQEKAICLSLGLTVTDVAYEDLLDERNLHDLLGEMAHGQITFRPDQSLSSSLSKQRERNSRPEYEFAEWTPESSS